MSGWALGTAVAMLTFYAGALFLAVQHLNERFSDLFMPVLFLRPTVWITFASLACLVIVAGVLLLLPNTGILALAAFAVLLCAIAVALLATYRTLALVADGNQIISWIHRTRDSEAVLEDILWTAFDRADRRMVAQALKVGLMPGAATEGDLLRWLARHRAELAREWLARELLDVLLIDFAERPLTDQRRDLLTSLLRETLAAESFPLARDIVDEIMGALARPRPWTTTHASLLYEIGVAIWNIGERGVFFEPRMVKQPSQLEDTKDLFIARTNAIWYHVEGLSDPESVGTYTWALGELAHDLNDRNAREWMLSRMFDVMADGVEQHILTRRTVVLLANALGQLRHQLQDDEENEENIDSHVLNLAAIYMELPDDVDDPYNGEPDPVGHLLANGYVVKRQRTGKKVVCHKQEWIKPETYREIARMLGVKNFG